MSRSPLTRTSNTIILSTFTAASLNINVLLDAEPEWCHTEMDSDMNLKREPGSRHTGACKISFD